MCDLCHRFSVFLSFLRDAFFSCSVFTFSTMGNAVSQIKGNRGVNRHDSKSNSNQVDSISPTASPTSKPKRAPLRTKITAKAPKAPVVKLDIASADFDAMLNEVGDEIDGDYKSDSTSNDNSNSNGNSNVPNAPNALDSKLYIPMVKRIKDEFQYIKKLGSGGTCEVMLVSRNGELLALKEVSKSDKHNEAMFAKEVQLLQMLRDEVHVVDYHSSYQSKRNFYLATHFCSGGTFLDRVLSMDTFSEKTAIPYIHTILTTMHSLHQKDIVHRDLKLMNMVLDGHGDDAVLKIIDFGDSLVVEDDGDYNELVGTLYFLSPECRRDRKGWELKKSDLWSIGVICYILLVGRLPFTGNDQESTIKRIETGFWEFPDDDDAPKLSDSAKSFIRGLMTKDTTKRLSAAEALNHKFISDHEHTANDVDLLQQTVSELRKRNYSNKLVKIMVAAALDEIDEMDLDVVKKAFPDLDTKGTGYIDEEDICRFLVFNSNIQHKMHREQQAKSIMSTFSVASTTSNVQGPHHPVAHSQSVPINLFESPEVVQLLSASPPESEVAASPVSQASGHSNASGGDQGNLTLSLVPPDSISPITSETSSSPLAMSPTDHSMNQYNAKDKSSKQVRFSGNDVVANVNVDQKEDEDEDSPLRYISVEVFKQIINGTKAMNGKQYNVDTLIEELDPNETGQVSFAAIAKYSGLLKTVSISMYESDH